MEGDPRPLPPDDPLRALAGAMREDAPPPEVLRAHERLMERLDGGPAWGPGGGGSTVLRWPLAIAALIALGIGVGLFAGRAQLIEPSPRTATIVRATDVATPTPQPAAGEESPAVGPEPASVELRAAVAPTAHSQRPRVMRDPIEAPEAAPRPTEEELITEARVLARTSPRSPEIDRRLAEHEARFRDGALAEERRALAVQIAFARGECEHARALLESFRRRHDGSAHLERLDRLARASCESPEPTTEIP